MCSFKFDLQSILDETSFYMIKLHFSKLHEILAFSLVFAFEYFQSFKILSQYILNLYCLGWGWTIWSNLVNFCQYFMIRFVNSLNFFFSFPNSHLWSVWKFFQVTFKFILLGIIIYVSRHGYKISNSRQNQNLKITQFGHYWRY